MNVCVYDDADDDDGDVYDGDDDVDSDSGYILII